MIKHQIHIHSRTEEFGLKDFLEKTFSEFNYELNRLQKTIYDYKDSHYIFALEERTWVGILNNAISKAFPTTSVSIQEYGVHSATRFVGRADCLFHLTDLNGKEFFLLFEAKQYKETNAKYMHSDPLEYYNSIKNQAMKYYNAEIDYYKNKTVYVISIAFGWIVNQQLLKVAKEYFKISEKEDKSTDFCSLHYEKDSGVWVYGKIFKPK